jgi:hypothetical protein
MKKPRMATSAVTAPSTMKSLELSVAGRKFVWVDLPSPSRETSKTVHTCEDACSDKTREASGENLGTVEESNAGGDLCSSLVY